MKSAFRFVSLTVLALALLGMAQKPPGIIVRFYVEANKQRPAFIEKVPVVSEKSFRAIFPFRAADGTWGCAFKLDDQGKLDLDTVSSSKRGYAIVPLIITKVGRHQFAELVIDRPVTDGIISIPGDITELEIAELKKTYPIIGQAPKKKDKGKKGGDKPGTPAETVKED